MAAFCEDDNNPSRFTDTWISLDSVKGQLLSEDTAV